MTSPRSRTAVLLSLLVAGSAAACGSEDPGGRTGAEPDVQTISLETDSGTEVVPFSRYASPAEYDLPFTTYIPPGFDVNPRLEGETDGISFTWSAAASDSATIYVVVLDPATGEDEAREIVRTAAERVRVPGNRTELEPLHDHGWAVVEYPIRSRGSLRTPLEGWVGLGHEQQRWFYIMAYSAVSAWPRFSARVEKILENWQWIGSGPLSGLVRRGLGAAAPG